MTAVPVWVMLAYGAFCGAWGFLCGRYRLNLGRWLLARWRRWRHPTRPAKPSVTSAQVDAIFRRSYPLQLRDDLLMRKHPAFYMIQKSKEPPS
jgi:hypothetical protein